jgi:kynurenine 3-monooxygenase
LDVSSEVLTLFFDNNFPDFFALIGKDTLIHEYQSHAVASLITVQTWPFHYKDKCVMLGDAIHAMAPFYGQGMNCGFEDVQLLMQLYDASSASTSGPYTGFASILARFTKIRKPQVDAICQLATENYWEMSSHVLSFKYKYKQYIIGKLAMLFPRVFCPQYTMVSFTSIPYDEVIATRHFQSRLLHWSMPVLSLAALISYLCWKRQG